MSAAAFCAKPLPLHRWRVTHVDAAGKRRVLRVTASTSWSAHEWVTHLYGPARACALVRLSATATPVH